MQQSRYCFLQGQWSAGCRPWDSPLFATQGVAKLPLGTLCHRCLSREFLMEIPRLIAWKHHSHWNARRKVLFFVTGKNGCMLYTGTLGVVVGFLLQCVINICYMECILWRDVIQSAWLEDVPCHPCLYFSFQSLTCSRPELCLVGIMQWMLISRSRCIIMESSWCVVKIHSSPLAMLIFAMNGCTLHVLGINQSWLLLSGTESVDLCSQCLSLSSLPVGPVSALCMREHLCTEYQVALLGWFQFISVIYLSQIWKCNNCWHAQSWLQICMSLTSFLSWFCTS